MINKRYQYDEAAVASLTSARREAIKQFKDKLASGYYEEENVPCPCGVNDDELLAEKERWGVPMKTVICRQCGLIRTNPRLSEKSQTEFYRHEYPLITAKVDFVKNDERYYENLFNREYHRTYHIDSFIKQVQGQSWFSDHQPLVVADIGCGTGGMMQYFIDRKHMAYGCDYGKKAVAYGVSRGLNIKKGNASELGGLVKAELVIMSHILEHVAWPHQFISEVVELLRPGSLLYVELPGVLAISAKRNRNDFLRFLRVYHMLNFSLGTLVNLVESHGFRLVKGTQWIYALFVYDGGQKRAMRRQPNEYRKIRDRIDQLERWRTLTLPYGIIADQIRHNRKYFYRAINMLGLIKPTKALLRAVGYQDIELK